MKSWIIASIVLVLIIVGVLAVNALQTDKAVSGGGCKKCNGSCTAESNCGLASCGATNGGECTCGKGSTCGGSCQSGGASCGSVGCGVEKTGSCGCGK